ncbi:RagB/SusD family nutrient uptake outer membrane protein [Sphingobacterium lumbrici]|uniref:RagB/SusD family nutrient uptake outer membrane protein n=1 Tax=Sphingobacterium lumbrici TaxID=2559600 RepID=UPI00112D466B|nr:RagB/SusD family nutrient uptake outer membrane protein [Sphingobacterium lumbrici]
MFKKYLILICAATSFASCSFLDLEEDTNMQKEEAYGYFDNIKRLATYVYTFLPQDFGVIGNATRDAATDNAIYTWENSKVYDIYNDVWNPNNPIDDSFNLYTGIRSANSFLENFSLKDLERFKWEDNYKENVKQAEMLVHEVRALRAFYYLELAKRYGGIPLLTRTYTDGEINSVEKSSFSSIIEFIVSECDAVIPELPVSHKEFYNETGRVTRGMAMAVKSRALLYAASKLHNPGNNKDLWKKAAVAAYDIIKSNNYSLPIIDQDPLYHANGGNEVLKSSQLIFERRNGDSNTFESNNLPIGFEAANSGNTPTQNLVDAFEMADGTAFDWANDAHTTNPYANRDPRFYRNIVYNGSTLMNIKIETFEGGKNAYPIVGATRTGYYLKKYINESVSLSPTQPVRKPHHFIIFRYAEILLNYAEAMTEWQGADYVDADLQLSARQALNLVRQAAKMPNIVDSGTDFMKRLRNERRVELAFEDHRFWDIRRWMIGEVVKDIYGVKVQRIGGADIYTRVKIQERIWKEKMYLYPIPMQETYKNPNLGQNPEW